MYNPSIPQPATATVWFFFIFTNFVTEPKAVLALQPSKTASRSFILSNLFTYNSAWPTLIKLKSAEYFKDSPLGKKKEAITTSVERIITCRQNSFKKTDALSKDEGFLYFGLSINYAVSAQGYCPILPNPKESN